MAIFNTANLTSEIPDGEGSMVQVSYKSNVSRTNNVGTDILVTKSPSKTWVLPKDKITITTKITNNTDVDIDNLTFKENLGEGCSFVAGSVKIGSVAHDDLDAVAGFTIPATLGGSGGELEVSYALVADEYPTQEAFSLSSSVGVELDSKTFSVESDPLSIDVIINEIYVQKTASTTAVKSGDELVYTITISNAGKIQNTNLFFQDPIPEGTSLVGESVTIDGEIKPELNPETGFALKDLGENESVVVTFKVKIL